jgi:hypothetical protein
MRQKFMFPPRRCRHWAAAMPKSQAKQERLPESRRVARRLQPVIATTRQATTGYPPVVAPLFKE